MEKLLIYQIESSFCIIILFAVWYLLMRKDTFFSQNRFILLFIVAFSLITPLLNINLSNSFGSIAEYNLNEISLSKLTSVSETEFSFQNGLVILLLTVSFLLLIHHLISYVKVFKINSVSKKLDSNIKILKMNSNISPFSFYKWIFIPEQYSIEESVMIINHEKVHIRKKHYLDRLFIELVCIFLWFNPVIWILLNELKKIHEYEADYFVAFNKDIIGDYLQLLYKSATGVSFSAATLNFNVSIFMERIVMITKERSSKFAYVKQFLLMPIIFLLLINFSFSENQSSTENPKAKDGSTKVEVMPVFKGDLSQIMQSELKYPDAARKKGIQGKVVLGLYISENGTVSKIEVAESVEKSLDDEAVRVAGLLKNWEPAKSKNKSVAAKVFLPVQFKLN